MPEPDEEAPPEARACETSPLLPKELIRAQPSASPEARAHEKTPLLPKEMIRAQSSGPPSPSKRREAEDCCYALQAHSQVRRVVSISVISAALISVGVVAGMKLEGWSFITSLYFIVQVVTTIGYGDLTPTQDLTKLFCAVYILCSLVVLAYVFNLAAQQLARMHTNFIRQRLRVLEAMVFRHASADIWTDQTQLDRLHKRMKEMYGRFNKLVAATAVVVFFLLFGTVFYRLFESCSCSYGRTRLVGCRSDSHAACVSSGGHVLTWNTAFYMSVVTLTTVGFGDHTPKSEFGRIVAVFWMLFGVASMANWVAKLSEFFMKEQLSRDNFLREEINEQTFKSMDVDGDGYLSRAEYRSYILVRYGLVSQEELDSIDSHYDMLDSGGNNSERVTWEMVKAAQLAQADQSPSMCATPVASRWP